MIRSIRLQNLLSFGPDTPELELQRLNVLIGPNGSGKSNLLEAIGLLQAMPSDVTAPIRGVEGGGIREWMHKAAPSGTPAAIEAEVDVLPEAEGRMRHRIELLPDGPRPSVSAETIYSIDRSTGNADVHFVFADGVATLEPKSRVTEELRKQSVADAPRYRERSALSYHKDPIHYPELYKISEYYRRIAIYSEWSFGRRAAQRLPQPADGRLDILSERFDNLGLILNRFRRDVQAKRRLLSELKRLYDGIEDFDVIAAAGTVQVMIQEGDHTIPSTRLSDGTMRYLCLLAILCDPEPPPLICIEEPELGLHPDILPGLARLLVDASQRTQLIVTTHSDEVVDALTEEPASILVCRKVAGATTIKRLDPERLKEWLKEYSLGSLWRDGVLGGNRW